MSEALEAGPHILLGHIKAACDQREAGNDEQHGTDVSGFMGGLDVEQKTQQQKHQFVGEAGCRDACADCENKLQFPAEHLFADIVPDGSADKGTRHLGQPASQEKCKGTAGQPGGETCTDIAPVLGRFVDLVQHPVNFPKGIVAVMEHHFVHEVFHLHELLGVHAGACEGQTLGIKLVIVGNRKVDRGQSDVRGDGDADDTA